MAEKVSSEMSKVTTWTWVYAAWMLTCPVATIEATNAVASRQKDVSAVNRDRSGTTRGFRNSKRLASCYE